MARRTKEESLATRDLILDAAERVFQRRGVARTSLQEIAQEAGLTRGAIYWHFQNKVDVFDAMMLRVTLPMVAHLNQLTQDQACQPLQHLRQSMAQAFHQTVHDQQVRRVFTIASHMVEYGEELELVRERQIAERANRITDLERLLVLAVALGQVGCAIPARSAAIGLYALLDGLMSNWLLAPEVFDLEAVGAQTLDAYLAGLSPCMATLLQKK